MKINRAATCLSAVVGVVYLISATAAAQQRRGNTSEQPKPPVVAARGTTDLPPLPPGGPTPRMADGRSDLTGVWFAGNIGRASAWSLDRDREAPPTSRSRSSRGPRKRSRT